MTLPDDRVTAGYVDGFARAAVTRYDLPRRVIDIILNEPAGHRFLDVGVGAGGISAFVHQLNPRLACSGLDQVRSTALPDFIDFMESSCEEIPVEDAAFDIVLSSQLLEHLREPFLTVREMRRVLKQGGVCVIIVPYYRTLFLPDGIGNFYCDYTHVRPFTKVSLRRLLEDEGLTAESCFIHRNKKTLIAAPYLLLKSIFGDKQAWDVLTRTIVGVNLVAIAVRKTS